MSAPVQVHIYRANSYPATRYFDPYAGYEGSEFVGKWVTRRKRELVVTACCGQRRWRGNCRIQIYYDGVHVWCKTERGCKA